MRMLAAAVALALFVLAGCMGSDMPVQSVDDEAPAASLDEMNSFHLVLVHGEENVTVESGPDPPSLHCAAPDARHAVAPMEHEVSIEQKRLLHHPDHDLGDVAVVFAFDLVRMPSGCPLLHALYPDPLGSVPISMGAGGEYEFAWQDGEVVVSEVRIPAGAVHEFHYNHTLEQGDSLLHYEGWFRVEHHAAWPRAGLVVE